MSTIPGKIGSRVIYPKPTVAVLASIVLPGSGRIYLGKLEGIAQMGFFLIAVATSFTNAWYIAFAVGLWIRSLADTYQDVVEYRRGYRDAASFATGYRAAMALMHGDTTQTKTGDRQ